MRFLAAYQCKQCAAVSSLVFEQPNSEDRIVAIGEPHGERLRLCVEAQKRTHCIQCAKEEEVYVISWNGMLYGVGTTEDIDRMRKALRRPQSNPSEVLASVQNLCRLRYEGIVPVISQPPRTIPRNRSGFDPLRHRTECAATTVIPQIDKKRMR